MPMPPSRLQLTAVRGGEKQNLLQWTLRPCGCERGQQWLHQDCQLQVAVGDRR